MSVVDVFFAIDSSACFSSKYFNLSKEISAVSVWASRMCVGGWNVWAGRMCVGGWNVLRFFLLLLVIMG